MIARFTRFVLAAALVLAGQAALLHPLQHVDKQGALVHATGGQSQNQDKSPGKLCDVLASLTACVADVPRVLVVAEQGDLLPIRRQLALRTAEAPPFLSQGPPTLL